LGTAGKVVLLIDGAKGLENMGKDCFKDSVQWAGIFDASMTCRTRVVFPVCREPANTCTKRRFSFLTGEFWKRAFTNMMDSTL
jgi:hypothetical protein